MKALKTLILASALVGLAASPAVFAQAGMGPGGGHHREHRGGPGGPGGFDGHRLLEALDDIGASPAQRQQVEAIFKAARADVKALHQGGSAPHGQALKLWTAPTLDTAALEAQRKEQLARHEKVSARLHQAMLDAARVLTPEQRAKLGERMAKQMERRKARLHQRAERMKDHAQEAPRAPAQGR